MTANRTVLIAGASGIIGNAAVEHFIETGWDVIAVSRRPPKGVDGKRYRFVALDLMDAQACRAAAVQFSGVTYLDMFRYWFNVLRERKFLPPLP